MKLSAAQNGLYKQYEKLLQQFDNQAIVIQELKAMIKDLKFLSRDYQSMAKKFDEQTALLKKQNTSINDLTLLIKEKDALNAKLMTEIDRLKNQINKDSSNSSKPGSGDTKPPKTGANLYNGRVKSGKRSGGQKGHKGSNLSKRKIEEMINNNEIIVKEVNHIIKGKPQKTPTIKYKLGIEVIPYVEKHIFSFSDQTEDMLPKEFYTDVTYDENLKSICIELGAYNVVAIDRLSDFINVITNGLINVSNGSICNFYKEFSLLSEDTINQLGNEVLNSKLLYTDETESKINHKKGYFRNYSTESLAIYKARLRKGHGSIKEDNLLPRFTGTIMGDHDTALYSYGEYNVECNVHIIRYLEEIIQNVNYISWARLLKTHFFKMNKAVCKNKTEGLKKINDDKKAKYYSKYDEIILKAGQENKQIKSSFYRDKAETLLRRLIKYKNNHLEFINDFDIPFSNNLSERDLRIIKTKTKVSSFRSYAGAKQYADTLSIIKTAKKRGINPFLAIRNIYLKKPCFQ